MTQQEALDIIGTNGWIYDGEEDNWERGFLGMLRPFTGELLEENYHQLMLAIETIKPQLTKKKIDRTLVTNLFAICYFSRLWGLDKGGMLERNELLTADQTATLTKWVEDISEKIVFILCDIE